MFKRRYSFAVANQSPLRDPLNNALYKLSQRGVLVTLDRQYFPTICESSSATTILSSLSSVLTLTSVMLLSVVF